MKLFASNIYSNQTKFYEFEIVKKYIVIYFKEIFSDRFLIGTLIVDLFIIALNLISNERFLNDLKIFLSTSTFNIVFSYFNLAVIMMAISKLYKLEKQLNLSSLYKVLLINPRVFVFSKSVAVVLFIVVPYVILGALYFYSRH